MAGEQAIALDRFGLGARPGDTVGGDPRGWVLAQLPRYRPMPAALADQPTRAALAAQFRAYREEASAERAEKARMGEPAAPDPMDGAMEAPEQAVPQDSMTAPARGRGRARRGTRGAAGETRNGAMAGPADGDAIAPDKRMARRALRDNYTEAANARLTAALQTDAPFPERLVHFWSNHFAISADKVTVVPFAGNYEFEAIRPHVMGSFSDLLAAAVLHPAMLLFLDQAQSVGPNSALAQRAGQRARQTNRKLGLNENLGREIMELHTLGVRTGYSQADVTELARALTGWTIAGGLVAGQARLGRLVDAAPGDAVFAPALHEPGARTILGQRYPEGGGEQARAMLADLARHPATARHVATKLARHFIADTPPPAAVARIEQAFLSSGGDLPTVYRALVASPEAWAADQAKFRTPWDWIVASLRATGQSQLPGRQAAAGLLQQLGQPIWRPGSPAGWGDTAPDWAGPGALMTRVEVAQQIATRVGDRVDARALADIVLPGASAETRSAIARSESPALGLALMLSAPEFLRR